MRFIYFEKVFLYHRRIYLHIQYSDKLRNETRLDEGFLFFGQDLSETIENLVTLRKMFQFISDNYKKFSRCFPCSFENHPFIDKREFLEKEVHVIDVSIGVSLCQCHQLVGKDSTTILHPYICSIKIHHLVSIRFPDFSTHVHLDIGICIAI